ncbi:transposase [Streptomyces mayteni]
MESGCWTVSHPAPQENHPPRSCPPEFRRKVLALLASGRKVAEVAQFLGTSDQTICVWRRQHRIDTGHEPGITSSDHGRRATEQVFLHIPLTDAITGIHTASRGTHLRLPRRPR